MLNKKIVDLINNQINKEFFSSFLYLDMSIYYSDKNLNGFGNWFAVQTKEEYDHAMLFVKYLQNNSEKVMLTTISSPTKVYSDFIKPLKDSLEHEIMISASINEIYSEAFNLKDFKTMQFLDWFVKEQGEEEQRSEDLNKRFDLFGTDPRGLYLLDAELATRAYSPPTLIL